MRRVRLLADAAALAVSTIAAVPFVTIAGATIVLDPGVKCPDEGHFVAPGFLKPFPDGCGIVALARKRKHRPYSQQSTSRFQPVGDAARLVSGFE